ncbi:hypothetical protein C8J36_102633 [Rhizobium sp. PP-F2F-G48]|uniref:hypothetical protein n=1 Tax=Rhizobium sp. PP-F2F-G48 TaxID=2135651 RepID=UPI00104EB9A0|nr:hypothetical protein [Rhizobium sp. PP-F2F-G48]TCM57830.1 hypothetical protein C8J36_102633 [Rhizobium sp. PP-F2F-G48]
MTPAEAREIDRQEFEAECAAVRRRLYEHLLKVNGRRDTHVQRCISRGYEAPRQRFNVATIAHARMKPSPAARRPAATYEAFGRVQTLEQWANEYGIQIGTIRTRLKLRWTIEAALSKPVKNTGYRAHKKVLNEVLRESRVVASLGRGVVSDFAPSKGTGGGSTAREIPEIDFSEMSENA